MRNLVSSLRVLGAVAVPLALLIGAAALPANAQTLSFSLTPAQRDGLPGQTVTFTGILSNPNNFTVYIDNIGATFTDQNSANNLTILPSGNLPTSIAANSFYNGDVFDALISSTASYDRLFGTVTVFGGSAPGLFNPLTAQNFVVVPETNTAALMATVAMPFLGAAVVRVRRRKTAIKAA